MHRIHLVDGGLGSVGKSVFCRVLIQYHIDRQRQYHFVEADQENPDVALCYPKRVEVDENGDELIYVSRVIFADPAPSGFDPNPIFNWALAKPVIINLPFYAFKPVNHWLDSTGAIEMGQKHNIRFCKWFLTNGRQDSLKLFAESVELFQGSIDHVLVCNHYFRKNWNYLEAE
jgi:GTPase SAR1 family protein